jgi:CysZ protein
MVNSTVLRKGPQGLFGGFMAAFRGLSFFFRHPRLMFLASIPVAINALLFALFFYFSVKYFNQWLTAMVPQSEAWYWVALIYLLTIILIVILLLAIALTFTMVASILGSPFHDAISARTEILVTGREEPPFTIKAILAEIWRTVKEELKKIIFYLVAIGLILLLNLIPVIGQILYVVLSFTLTILWLGMSFLDYTFARHAYKFGMKIRFVRQNMFAVFGFGLAVFVGVLIPVLNLVFLPVAVVGGTLLYLELSQNGSEEAPEEVPAETD